MLDEAAIPQLVDEGAARPLVGRLIHYNARARHSCTTCYTARDTARYTARYTGGEADEERGGEGEAGNGVEKVLRESCDQGAEKGAEHLRKQFDLMVVSADLVRAQVHCTHCFTRHCTLCTNVLCTTPHV